MVKVLKAVLLFLFGFAMLEVLAQEDFSVKKRGIVPDYLNMQFAGNIGSGSIGAGYYLNPSRTLFFDAVYGYSPAFRSGRAIHNIVVRLVAKPYSLNLKKQYSLKPLLSIAVSKQIADDDRTFSRLPKNFPEGYYAPNAFRLHFDLGLALRKDIDKSGIIKAVEFYANTTTNEMYVTYFIRSQSVNLGDIFSLTLGFNLYLFE